MRVRVKLMGALKGKTPEGGTLELPDEATVDTLLATLEIDPRVVQVVMVNNKPQKDRTLPLSPDDELTILPPVGGG